MLIEIKKKKLNWQWHILLHQHQLVLVHIQPHHQLAIQPWMAKPASKILFLWRPNPGVMASGKDGKPTHHFFIL